jgi:heterodisulfide reductase subunit A
MSVQKIGVFVCWCGSNIAATVDVAQVVAAVKNIPDVAFAADYKYMCSEGGQELIHTAIKEHKLNRIVVCSCSPRMHEVTFRNCAEAAGINPYLVEIANIREQCSWILKDKAEATAKAIELAKAAIAKVRLNTCLLLLVPAKL